VFSSARAGSQRVITARFAKNAPRIDGSLEPLWQSGDSATGFIQQTPAEGEPASESTTAYLLSDDKTLYVAFRCLVRDRSTLYASLSGASDGVALLLDPFCDNTACYQFWVDASGCETDCRITDDGDWSEEWDGVWRSSVRCYDWGYAVEMAVPFKTLRYAAGRTEWAIDFSRTIVAANEVCYWSGQERKGFRVSKMGRLAGVAPGRSGLRLELYPVGLVRVEHDSAFRARPSGGLDIAWLPAPTANLQLTAFPDFAQIEADPYQVNLTRYELWLSERRPFFTEAAEMFGTGYQPVKLFYSRRIGQALPDGSAVPIVAGAKFTGRFSRTSLGALTAWTGRTNYDLSGVDTIEPAGLFGAATVRQRVFSNSEVGALYAVKANEGFLNQGAKLDAGLRFGDWRNNWYVAVSQYDSVFGYSAGGKTSLETQTWNASLEYKRIADEFNMNGPGYTSFRGEYAGLSAGPRLYNLGPVQSASLWLVGQAQRDWDEPFSWYSGFNGYSSFTNRAYANVWAGAKYQAERDERLGLDTTYWMTDVGLLANTDYAAPVQLWFAAGHTSLAFNYRRFKLAPNAYADAGLSGRIGDHLLLGTQAQLVAEFDTEHRLNADEDLTLSLRPSVDVTITPKMSVRLAGEGVFGYDPVAGRPYRSYYASFLYSWTFRPRSTFYLAVNERHETDEGAVRMRDRTAVVKLRYLFVF